MLLKLSVSPQLREATSEIASACFTASCPGEQRTPQGSPEATEKELPCAGPLLLSWAGLGSSEGES